MGDSQITLSVGLPAASSSVAVRLVCACLCMHAIEPAGFHPKSSSLLVILSLPYPGVLVDGGPLIPKCISAEIAHSSLSAAAKVMQYRQGLEGLARSSDIKLLQVNRLWATRVGLPSHWG